MDYIRKKQRKQRLHDNYHAETSYLGEGETPKFVEGNTAGKEKDALLEKLKNLTGGDKKLKILWLKYALGMSIKEISKLMSISDSAVKMRLKRAKEVMKMRLEPSFSLN